MKKLSRLWYRFWFAPAPSGPLGLYRIAFGVLVIGYVLLLFPDRALWFSEHGVVHLADSDMYNGMNSPGPIQRPDLLHFFPGDRPLTLFFVVFLLAAVSLMLGLATRLSALIVFVCLCSLHARDSIIHNSGDTVMRVMSAYLLLGPSGAACSLDRLWRILRGRENDDAPLIAPWSQRLIQIQVCLIYLTTVATKFQGHLWRNGTAVYYPLHLPESVRFPLFWIDGRHLWLIRLMTWGTLATELAMGVLLWVPRLRLPILALGVLLHLGIEYSLNIPLFAFLMITSYLVFVRQDELHRFVRRLHLRLASFRLRLVYDGECDFCRSSLLLVHFLDVFRLVTFLDYHDPAALAAAPEVRFEQAEQAAIAVDPQGRCLTGFFAWRALAWRLPALWVLAPLLWVPGVPWLGVRAYAWVVRNRSRLPVAPRFRVRKPPVSGRRKAAV